MNKFSSKNIISNLNKANDKYISTRDGCQKIIKIKLKNI